MFLNWIWQLNQLLTSMNEEMSSQITTFLVCLFTLCASVRLLSTVGEHMILQNSISTNDFSHSEQGWGFSPVCISKCLPNVPALLNDFLHSVVQLCGFSPLSMNMCSINFPVCVNDFLHCAQVWGFSPVWIGIWVLRFPAWLNDFLHSVHLCGFSPLWMSMYQIMWLRNICTCCICLDSLQCVFWCNISWATVPVEKLHWLNLWAIDIEKNIFGSKIGWYIGNNRGCLGNCLMRPITNSTYFILVNRGSGPRDLEKRSKIVNLWVKI